MINSKLIQNLAQLSNRQWTAFLKFLASPYHNQQSQQLELAQYLFSVRPNWSEETLDRRRLFRLCFPEKRQFHWQSLKDLASVLQKKLRLFLAMEEVKEQTAVQQALVIEGAMKNGMTAIWQRQLRLFKEKHSAAPVLRYSLLEKHKNKTLRQGQRPLAAAILHEQVATLDDWYWKERLRLAVESISISSVLKEELHENILAGLDHLPAHCETIPAVSIYQNILQMLLTDFPQSSSSFQALKRQLIQNDFPSESEEEIYSFYVYALNYCTGRINSGDSGYYAALFEVYQLLEQHQRLTINDQLSQWTFLNIIATACNLKKYQWARRFITKYHAFIPLQHRDNAFHYNFALLFFYQSDYDQSLEHLLKVSQSDDPYYELNGRILQLRVFFEKREWLLLDSLLERLRIYLLRNTAVSGQRKQECQHFIRKIKQLFLIINDSKLGDKELKSRTNKFLESLDDDKPLMHRKWLRRMAERVGK